MVSGDNSLPEDFDQVGPGLLSHNRLDALVSYNQLIQHKMDVIIDRLFSIEAIQHVRTKAAERQ